MSLTDQIACTLQIIVNIVMLSHLLIALMGGSYECVAETAKLVTLKNRAELILQYEVRMSVEQLANKQWHPTYLHALVPADDDMEEELDDDDEAGWCTCTCQCM